jgi:hypothetical protein
MSSHRPYCSAPGPETARVEIRSGGGTGYAVDVEDVRLAVLEQNGLAFPD